MTKQLIFTFCIYAIVWIAAFPSSASSSQEDEALFELSLQELLQVYTPSTELSYKHTAPAVISVVTKEQIATRGYESLFELLQHLPGIYFNTSGHFVNLTSRGVSQTLTSFLLLIAGHAVNNRSAYGISVETVFRFCPMSKELRS